MTENHADLNNLLKIPCRLVIKNIPVSLSDDKIKEIFKEKFDGKDEVKDDMIVIKLEKKYSMKNRNKICLLTVDNFETRQKIIDFISKFELIDPKGIKQKLTVNDCLLQKQYRDEKDSVMGTFEELEHFKKFKEYFEKDKIIDFKTEENKCNFYII